MKIVALFLAGYLLLGSLFPGMDYSQLTRLPNLYFHFQEHQSSSLLMEETESISDFLIAHFWSTKDHHQQDIAGHAHGNLPLSVLSGSFHFVPTQQAWVLLVSSEAVHPRFMEWKALLPQGVLPDVFIPPSV
jgi:hypothetical protein